MDFVDISSERLAYWFLRLNGFLTIYNFVVHPEEAGPGGHYYQQTDIDVMGVRFPHRKENRKRPMEDHKDLINDHMIQLVLAETKSGKCQLNNSWIDSNRENMQKALSAVGILSPELIDEASAALYKVGQWSNGDVWVRWAVFGESQNRTLRRSRPNLS